MNRWIDVCECRYQLSHADIQHRKHPNHIFGGGAAARILLLAAGAGVVLWWWIELLNLTFEETSDNLFSTRKYI